VLFTSLHVAAIENECSSSNNKINVNKSNDLAYFIDADDSNDSPDSPTNAYASSDPNLSVDTENDFKLSYYSL